MDMLKTESRSMNHADILIKTDDGVETRIDNVSLMYVDDGFIHFNNGVIFRSYPVGRILSIKGDYRK